jgi:alpha-D-xyloside xylohydrolase
LPPTEPWEFDAEFVELFRASVNFRYRLLPYILAQAAEASRLGHPLLRPLFFEFPKDRGSWVVDDQYLLGSQLLVAPLFEPVGARAVYLPPGQWVDLQSKQAHVGPGWVTLEAGDIPAIILARGGSAIVTIEPAPHTGALDWSQLTVWCIGGSGSARGWFWAPRQAEARALEVTDVSGAPRLTSDPSGGDVTWSFEQVG